MACRCCPSSRGRIEHRCCTSRARCCRCRSARCCCRRTCRGGCRPRRSHSTRAERSRGEGSQRAPPSSTGIARSGGGRCTRSSSRRCTAGSDGRRCQSGRDRGRRHLHQQRHPPANHHRRFHQPQHRPLKHRQRLRHPPSRHQRFRPRCRPRCRLRPTARHRYRRHLSSHRAGPRGRRLQGPARAQWCRVSCAREIQAACQPQEPFSTHVPGTSTPLFGIASRKSDDRPVWLSRSGQHPNVHRDVLIPEHEAASGVGRGHAVSRDRDGEQPCLQRARGNRVQLEV